MFNSWVTKYIVGGKNLRKPVTKKNVFNIDSMSQMTDLCCAITISSVSTRVLHQVFAINTWGGLGVGSEVVWSAGRESRLARGP